MEDTIDITQSHGLISSGTPEQWSSFQQSIEMIQLQDLANIADRLGCAQQTTWQDYANEFAAFEWYQFCEAYQHCLYRAYSLTA